MTTKSTFAVYFAEEMAILLQESHIRKTKESGIDALQQFLASAEKAGRLVPALRKATYRVDSTDGTSKNVLKASAIVQFCGGKLSADSLGIPADKVNDHLLARIVVNAMRRSFCRAKRIKGAEAKAAWKALCRSAEFAPSVESAPPKASPSESELGALLAAYCK